MTPTAPLAPPPPVRSPAYVHWKEIAAATMGILSTEPRYSHILTMLQRCDDAFKSGNESAFLKAKQQLLNFIAASTPRIKPTSTPPASQTAQSA